MAFSESVIEKAWKRASGRCECTRWSHKHNPVRCGKELVFANRCREGQGRWDAHRVSPKYNETLYNCEILCAAVRLWWRYVNDYDQAALRILLEYNKEDVLNLKTLRDKLQIER